MTSYINKYNFEYGANVKVTYNMHGIKCVCVCGMYIEQSHNQIFILKVESCRNTFALSVYHIYIYMCDIYIYDVYIYIYMYIYI